AYNLYSGGSGTGFYVFPKPAPQPSTAHVSIAIEGPEAPIAEGTVYASNVLDALKRLAVAKDIPLSVSSNDYVTSIQGISAGKYGSYDGWMYAVIRNGQYADANTGMAGFALQNSDQVLIYYTGSDTGLVDSVTFSPVNPKPGEAFTATVMKKASANVNGSYELVTVPAGNVQINIGGETVSTDNQGVASFSSKAVQSSGTYTVTITGHQSGAAPSIVRAKTILYAGGEKNPAVHAAAAVEGPQGPIAEGEIQGSTALEALKDIAWKKDLGITVTGGTYGDYVTAIQGVEAGAYGGFDGWNYAVKRDGQWISPSVGAGAFPLLQGDQVVFYYGDFGTQLVNSVTVSKPQLQAGDGFNVTVSKLGWDYDPVTYEPTPVISGADGVQVAVGGQTADTNGEGIASFDGLPAGNYTITVTGYKNNAAPGIVRYTQPLIVSGQTNPPALSKATISVVGNTVKGTILPSTSVPLNAGDTPYSLLVRTLGSGKVGLQTTSGGVYVYAIDGLAEYDGGPESGWKYFVNGNEPSVGADKYVLQDGDEVLWKYVTSLTETSTGSTSGTPDPAASSVAITSANTLPLNQVGATTAVSGTPMTAEKSAELAKTLAANSVSLARLATSAGATLKDAAGEVQLQIPAGAVEGGTVTINVQEQPSSRPELVSGLYEFTPNGTKFAKPTDLSIQIPVGARYPQNLALAWLDEKTNQWIPVPAVLDLSTGTISGKVSHFTKYAVVDRSKWEPAGSAIAADISAAAEWILSAGELSDWQAFGLARSGNALPSGYLAGVLKQIAESKGEFRKVTDYERLALSITAAGGDPRNAAGCDLIAKIYNNKNLTNQGSNGPIFALLALDSGNYSVPADAAWTREKLVQWILDIQNTDGGFPLTKGGENNVDLTAMAVAALSAHKEEAGVQAAVDQAVAWLSAQQLEDGGYKLSGEENSESVAQVIIALSAAGIGPGDVRFVKAKGSLLGNLATFKRSDGGYAHTVNGGSSGLATEQALLALTAYDLYLNGKGKLYSLTDAPAAAGIVFADEHQISAWALSSVHEAFDKKLMEGMGGASPLFAPKSAITRAQFAALLVRLTGNTPAASTAVSGFDDVKPNSWYYGYVMKAKELGVIGGVTAASFKPNQPVSRQDMAVMIARAYKLSPSSRASFKDGAAIGNYALDAVNAVTEKGYMTGFGGSFDPSGVVTREMAAVVAVRLP
ncbi:DUF4430 domain-containing protein, partial [Paenibacillus zanthoxyli]|uniref:DUF4430 domain-containing protein n=1 Tax=Paenibacillus zanthoxyli TaxID=369399 RepID=UPI0004713000